MVKIVNGSLLESDMRKGKSTIIELCVEMKTLENM